MRGFCRYGCSSDLRAFFGICYKVSGQQKWAPRKLVGRPVLYKVRSSSIKRHVLLQTGVVKQGEGTSAHFLGTGLAKNARLSCQCVVTGLYAHYCESISLVPVLGKFLALHCLGLMSAAILINHVEVECCLRCVSSEGNGDAEGLVTNIPGLRLLSNLRGKFISSGSRGHPNRKDRGEKEKEQTRKDKGKVMLAYARLLQGKAAGGRPRQRRVLLRKVPRRRRQRRRDVQFNIARRPREPERGVVRGRLGGAAHGDGAGAHALYDAVSVGGQAGRRTGSVHQAQVRAATREDLLFLKRVPERVCGLRVGPPPLRGRSSRRAYVKRR